LNNTRPALLSSGFFIQLHPEMIKKLGSATQAICLQQLYYWLERSENEYNGNKWVYNTYEEWSENIGLTPKQIRSAMNALEELGIVITCQPKAYDRTKWYSIDYSHGIWADEGQIHLTSEADGSAPEGVSTNYTKNTQREPKNNQDTEVNDLFTQFWSLYPLKKEKAKAAIAFKKALKKVSFDQLIAGVHNLIEEKGDDLKYCPHATTWLNGERWTDIPIPRKRSFLEEFYEEQQRESIFIEMKALN